MSESLTAHVPVESVGFSKIDRLEEYVRTLPQADCPIRHIFSDGIYAREMTAPPGAVITGAVHKTRHLNIISKGSITVFNEQGGVLKHIQAPCAFISEPGTRRAGLVHEELVWTTIHPTQEIDISKLEEILIEKPAFPLLNSATKPCLSS